MLTLPFQNADVITAQLPRWMLLHFAATVENSIIKLPSSSCYKTLYLHHVPDKRLFFFPLYSLTVMWSAFFLASGKLFVLQLAVWGLRGVTRVILANNPLSGALILAALYWASPWQALLGTLGVLTSTLTAIMIGQDRWNHLNLYTNTVHLHIWKKMPLLNHC